MKRKRHTITQDEAKESCCFKKSLMGCFGTGSNKELFTVFNGTSIPFKIEVHFEVWSNYEMILATKDLAAAVAAYNEEP